eukprot:TRINITY_DN24170_c0_g1_i2.p1 TRINITY_DN24170_c0_g1~~TRINITY_DN24170_c0_g1_i2.p1  ORF type:complete len:144 (+),score=33.60 TRINITY_DN24170_c0_g1_i2:25-456(+)
MASLVLSAAGSRRLCAAAWVRCMCVRQRQSAEDLKAATLLTSRISNARSVVAVLSLVAGSMAAPYFDEVHSTAALVRIAKRSPRNAGCRAAKWWRSPRPLELADGQKRELKDVFRELLEKQQDRWNINLTQGRPGDMSSRKDV